MRRTLPTWSRVSPALLALSLLAAVACDSTDSGTLQLVTGEETTSAAFANVSTLTVYAIDSSDDWSMLGSPQPYSSTTDIDLGDQDESNGGTVMVLGTDTHGNDVLAGASLGLQYGALAGSTLPVFVQQTNQWARLPSPPTDARQSPTLAVISGEYLFIGGGSGSTSDGKTLQLYDFGGLTAVSNPPTLDVAPLSMPVIGTVGLVLGANGNDEYYDFSQDASANVPALPSPDGFTFDDVAGGQVIYDYDSSSATLEYVFVVGATRTQGPATAAVLEIDATDTSNSDYPSGNLHWLSLTTPRLGAAAAWTNEALVVIGGNTGGTGPNLPAGAEQLVPGPMTSTFTALTQFPFDPTIGAGAVASSTAQVVVAGGILPTGQDPGVRLFNVECPSSTGCITSWGSLPIPLTSAAVFQLESGGSTPYLAVGSELQSGLTHTFLLSSTGPTELPTKAPHYNASAISSPVGFGAVLLFGGADEIEQLMPPQTPP